ncbi:hypothetical protein JG688_00001386 [Phytophthora aleatoria]|uniref:FH2 domain-containing protein n=1 Tax=Phytophthora aleatoria TaxID=2496075 RepID=A0A8J5JGS7_9STRA|nr:hypothetical protein JG688_00001386 [Phytophthora aleatoria]
MPLTAASFLLQAAPWVSLDVRRGSVADISIPIPSIAAQENGDPQECLLWQFQLQEYDVGFQLLENETVVQDLGRFKAAEQGETDPNANASVLPHSPQLEALDPTTEGRFDNVKPESVYTLRWDNSYSLVRHKQVQYRFLVTSNRVVAAAELAVQESQSRSQRRARRAAAGMPLAHLAKTLEKERAMNDEKRKVANERVAAKLEQAVMDIVSIFIAKPDSPLHEGAVRPFILALEAVLCNGIKEKFLDVWPEAPFYEFLLETQHVLRDDMGIVAEVQAGEPPPNLQHLGWNKSRSFLLLALNKGILQRAFENLIKRRVVVEKYYEPRALLYKYEDARKIASFLSALNGVTFLLAAYPPDEGDEEDQPHFPRNLKQCAPEAPLLGNEISFHDDVEGGSCVVKFIEGDPDEIKHLENCTVPRYILHGEPFQDIAIGYVSPSNGWGINAMLFASQFKHQQQELRNRIRVITQACYEILRSERLARCFELVLAIGNLLNTGTELEGAQGITLASLLKLSETKAIDQSMTLLQFIIKLIHDRGEGDVLLFTNDLCTLAEAKRYSNVICDSQVRALQHEITKLEQEIKEDMVEDLKRFNKAEALRKRQLDERKVQRHRPVLLSKHIGLLQRNGMPNNSEGGDSEPRNAMFAQNEKNGLTSSNPLAAMMAAIRCRGEAVDAKSTEENLQAIRFRRSADEIGDADAEVDQDAAVLPASTPHAALLNAIRSRPQSEDDSAPVSEAERASSVRSSLLASIIQREQPTSNLDIDQTGPRSAILASKQRRPHVPEASDSAADQNGMSSLGGDSQAALLAAIRQRAKKSKKEMPNGTGGFSKKDEEFEPRQYKMESKFISVMREQLMNIKAAFEDIEMDSETLHSVWDGTARYLAEDPSGSSTEYVFGLLNRFLLDVKVAKTLLFRKGLSFASEANALLPHAYVGSIVATKFGAGVITALRVTDKRIEVKFPWSREAYLAPSSILSVGSLVRCRLWGVGIIRDTCYDVGFCDVRFTFGYGKIRVDDLVVETSSNKEDLRLALLRCGFFIGDPVITPFGCGHVQSIRGRPQSSTAVLSVGLLASDRDIHDEERVCTAVAFMPASNVKRNY